MSRHWMKMYWADYLGDTMHLSQGQHGAYLLLIAHYWNKGELQAKHCYSIARAMLEQERSNVDEVLEQFFERDGEFWRHRRVDQEIAEAQESYARRANAGSRGGKARAERSSNAQAMPEQCSSNAQAMLKQPEPEPEPDISTTGVVDKGVQTAKPPRFDPLSLALPGNLAPEKWAEWVDYRRKSRKPLTKPSAEKQLAMLGASGMAAGLIIEQSIRNSWQGLFPLKGAAPTQTQDDRSKRHADFVAGLTGRQTGASNNERTIEGDYSRLE